MREVLGDSMLIISWFKRSFLNYLHVVVQGMKEIRPGFDIIDPFLNYEVSPRTYSFANLQTISFSAASTSTST